MVLCSFLLCSKVVQLCTYIVFHILFHYGLLQDIGYSFLAIQATLLFIHSVYSSLHLLIQTPNPFFPHPETFFDLS